MLNIIEQIRYSLEKSRVQHALSYIKSWIDRSIDDPKLKRNNTIKELQNIVLVQLGEITRLDREKYKKTIRLDDYEVGRHRIFEAICDYIIPNITNLIEKKGVDSTIPLDVKKNKRLIDVELQLLGNNSKLTLDEIINKLTEILNQLDLDGQKVAVELVRPGSIIFNLKMPAVEADLLIKAGNAGIFDYLEILVVAKEFPKDVFKSLYDPSNSINATRKITSWLQLTGLAAMLGLLIYIATKDSTFENNTSQIERAVAKIWTRDSSYIFDLEEQTNIRLDSINEKLAALSSKSAFDSVYLKKLIRPQINNYYNNDWEAVKKHDTELVDKVLNPFYSWLNKGEFVSDTAFRKEIIEVIEGVNKKVVVDSVGLANAIASRYEENFKGYYGRYLKKVDSTTMETNRLLDRFKPFFRKPKKFNAYFTDCSFCADTIIDHLKLKGFKVAEIVKDSNLLRSINKDLYTFYFEDGYGCNIRYSDSINVLQNKPVYFSLFLIRDQLPLFINKYKEDVSIQLVFTEPFWLEKRGQLLECILKYLPGLKPSDIEIAYDTDFQKSPSAALRLVWKNK